jgi:hypothetical protein
MSDIQADEFRARLGRIEQGEQKPKRALLRNTHGATVGVKRKKKRLSLWLILKPLLITYLVFLVLKSAWILQTDEAEYARVIADLEAGNANAKFIALALSPDYFTEPVGNAITYLVDLVEKSSAEKQ